MKKSILLFLLFCATKAQAQSSSGFLDKIYYVISNETKDTLQSKEDIVRKNAISLQILGDTPFLGMKYSRRVYQSSDFTKLIEAGLGVGIPGMGYSRGASLFCYSHHTTLIFRASKILSPFVSYSGIFDSGEFYKGKHYNYRPSPSVGLRFGNLNKFSVNASWQGYFYNNYRYDLIGDDRLQVYKQHKLFSVFGVNLYVPFK